ncbi:MAG TPA: exopolysaccharide transport family protein [Rhodoblastus sp.]|nr:exopolysaccharide transport family protein [Rhodoblastus sp.]
MRVESPAQGQVPRAAGDAEIDLGGIGAALWANRKWVVGATVLALCASTAFVNIVKPRYTAETRVLLELQSSFMPGEETKGDAAGSLDAEAVGSQIQLVTSRDVARRAIKQIGLLGNPEFDPMSSGLGAMSRVLVLLGVKRDPSQMSPEDRVFENYYDKLQVSSPTKTRVLNIEFSSHDPDLAAKAANSIAGIYLDFQQDAKRANARSAAASLSLIVADLKTRVAAAESKVEDFRAETGLLVGTNNTTITAQQLGEVNTELARARTSQADAQAKAKLIREMLKQGRVGEIPDVANNDLVRRISEQRVTLKAQLALESRTLLPGHPRIKELTAQLADLDGEMRAAADKAARTLDNDARIAGQRLQNLQASLDQQKKVVGSLSAEEVKLRELERTAKSLKDDLEAATTKYQQALARENSKSTPADARIVSRAVAPQVPSFPKKIPIIAFSTLAALFLSAAFFIARELLREGPAPRAVPAPLAPPSEPAVAAPAEPAAPRVVAADAAPAALLGLSQSFAQSVADAAGQTPALALSVCEGDSDDGFALASARALARRGRAILVALDEAARMPQASGAGLAELLSGRASFDETIHRDQISRLHFLGAGAGARGGADALLSALDALMEAYDFVVVAGSAALDLDDAYALAQLAKSCAVYASDPYSAASLADALEKHGLPRPTIFGAEDARLGQSAA